MIVIGQKNFNMANENNGTVTADSLNAPWSVSSDGTRLFVGDGDCRVKVYGSDLSPPRDRWTGRQFILQLQCAANETYCSCRLRWDQVSGCGPSSESRPDI